MHLISHRKRGVSLIEEKKIPKCQGQKKKFFFSDNNLNL